MTTNVNPNSRVALTLFSAAALFGSLSLSSCQDYEPFSEAEVHATMAAREFTNNFEQRYGKIDPNHDWGFHELEPYSSNSDTRTTIDVNLNQWLSKYENIPGYPFLNDEYIQVRDNSERGFSIKPYTSRTKDDFPYGDVTDYEIQWVSEWFRTYPEGSDTFEGAKVNLNISEFFIQNISKDRDQESYIQDGIEIPAYPNGRNKTEKIDEIHKLKEDGNFDLEYLHCKEAGVGSKTVDENNGWVHINNYNAGNTNFDPQGVSVMNPTNNRELKLVTSGGTSDFAASVPCVDAGDKWMYDWVLVKLTWTEPYNGKEYQREGYYLAFDYRAWKSNGFDYKRDGYYSNWIVKITPAYYKPTPHTTRIMCEDLGNTFDFDFNDVVFDVAYEKNSDNSIDAVVTLQAAGGTMPIYVGTNSAGMEAHKLLGNKPSTTPINVSSVTSNPTTYRIKNVSTTNPDDITIYVNNTRDNQTYQKASANRGNLAQHDGSNGYNDGDKLNVGANGASMAPQKFAVPSSVRWMKETEQIETAYPNFEDWVQDAAFLKNDKEWYHNANMDPNGKIWNVGAGFSGEDYSGGGSGSGDVYAPKHQLNLVLDNPEMGSATFSDGTYSGQSTGSFSYGETVKVHAQPATGYKFWRWKFRNTAETLSTSADYTFEYSRSMRDLGELVAYFLPAGDDVPGGDQGGGQGGKSNVIAQDGNTVTVSNITSGFSIPSTYFSTLDNATSKVKITVEIDTDNVGGAFLVPGGTNFKQIEFSNSNYSFTIDKSNVNDSNNQNAIDCLKSNGLSVNFYNGLAKTITLEFQ